MRLCAIHQPNFFPWLGYFDKINRADVFVFLDQVAYPKSGSSMGSWCNRVKINAAGTASWISCPVVREHGLQLIENVRIDNTRPWRDKLRATLETSYRKAPNFVSAYALVDGLLSFEADHLADFNINVIRSLSQHFGYETELIRQSELPLTNETSTARLVAICRAVGADAYLCGGGASGYQEDAAFAQAGLGLIFQQYLQLHYRRSDDFIPGLSVIDWLMFREE